MKQAKAFNNTPLTIEDETSECLIRKTSCKSRQKASDLVSCCNNALSKNKNKFGITPDKIMSGCGVPESTKKTDFKYKKKGRSSQISKSSLGYDEILFGHSSVIIPNEVQFVHFQPHSSLINRRLTLLGSTNPSSVDNSETKQIFKCIYSECKDCPCPLHRKNIEDLIAEKTVKFKKALVSDFMTRNNLLSKNKNKRQMSLIKGYESLHFKKK